MKHQSARNNLAKRYYSVDVLLSVHKLHQNDDINWLHCFASRVVASWGVGFAVGGQHQHSEGSSASARLVFLPADSEHAVVCLRYVHIHYKYQFLNPILLFPSFFYWLEFSSRQRVCLITYFWLQTWVFRGVNVSQTALWMTSLRLCVPSVQILLVVTTRYLRLATVYVIPSWKFSVIK